MVASSAAVEDPGSAAPRRAWPTRPIGWVAPALTVLALACWIILPVITIAFRDQYAWTDTWVMPTIGASVAAVAAVVNVLAVWLWRQRSTVTIVSAAVIVAVAIFVGLMVVGEALAGV